MLFYFTENEALFMGRNFVFFLTLRLGDLEQILQFYGIATQFNPQGVGPVFHLQKLFRDLIQLRR